MSEIRSAMNDIKKPPAFVCTTCGFEGIFKAIECPRCRDHVLSGYIVGVDVAVDPIKDDFSTYAPQKP